MIQDMQCPYCLKKKLKQEKRYGATRFVGDIVKYGVIIVILSLIHIEWLRRFYIFMGIGGLLIGFIQMIGNFGKPKNTEDIRCNNCFKGFIWNPETQTIVDCSGKEMKIEPEKTASRIMRFVIWGVLIAVWIGISVWLTITLGKHI